MELYMINNFLGIDVSKERFDVSLSFISKKESVKLGKEI
ncbi:transposase, IS110 family [Wolbachia endosymbiont of Drosophila ananassae]|nr:transposase, IS110 family [Wolbachia endosymbiont of Drosophila ananassae]